MQLVIVNMNTIMNVNHAEMCELDCEHTQTAYMNVNQEYENRSLT